MVKFIPKSLKEAETKSFQAYCHLKTTNMLDFYQICSVL